MGLFGKLFGGKSDGPLREGESLFEQRRFGEAKLAFERALDRAEESEKATIAERIDAACDEIALSRIAEAERLLDQDDEEMAREELAGALTVVASAKVRAEAQSILDELEREEAVEAAADAEVTDEEILLAVSGSWEPDQADEYEGYGDAFSDAILLVHKGDSEAAKPLLEAILAEALEDEETPPKYLWLEIGRVRLLTEDNEGGRDALIEFIDQLEDDEVGEPLLGAYIELARIADADGEFEEAMGFFEEAVETFDDDHRPYLAMGRFLLEHEMAEEAVEVLEAGSLFMDDIRPDWWMLQELGLAYAAVERDEEAIGQLERVVSFMTERKVLDFPPSTVLPLAALHEKVGAPDRAADLFAALTRGSDRANHAQYHAEAGRLLMELNLDDEAKRMLKRALALLPEDDDSDLRIAIEGRLAKLADA